MWNVPGWVSPDASYLDLVSDVLGSGKNSRFYKRLVYEDQIATDASAYVSLNEIGGQFRVVGTAQPGTDLAKVEAALDEELNRFLDQGPSDEEVERVRTQHVARFVRGAERIGGFGGKSDILARNQIYAGRPDHYKTALKRVQEATAEDLRESARRWLSDGVYALAVHPYPAYTKEEDGADRTKLPEVPKPPELVWPGLKKTTLSNGLKIILAERHETPVVEFELLMDAGFASDNSRPRAWQAWPCR